MNYYWTKQKRIAKKVHDKYHNRGGKKKAAKHDKKNRGIITEKREISTQTCQKKIKEQKLNIKKKDTGKIKNLTSFLSSDNFDFV